MLSSQSGHIVSTYYAPRGRRRIFELGIQLAQLYLSPFDLIIGVIGEAGSGKSALIKGMFPGLELTNDDDGVNVRPLPLLEQDMETGFFSPHTYHVDIRFETGFTSMNRLADAILEAVNRGKRVVIEHFDLVYPMLGRNADLLIGVGGQILITRPNLFGPHPQEIYDNVYSSLPYRLMAHTAEDLCEFCLPPEDKARCEYSDVRHGFIIAFPGQEPTFDLREIEKKVQGMIDQALPVTYLDEGHITIGDAIHPCTGPRTHVHNTSQIKNFHLLYRFLYDQQTKRWLMVGCVGDGSPERLAKLEDLNPCIQYN